MYYYLCVVEYLEYENSNPTGCGAKNFITTYCTARCWPRVSAACFTSDTDYLIYVCNITQD